MENEPLKASTGKKGEPINRGIAIAVLVMMLIGAGYVAFSWYYFYWNAPDRKNSDMAYLWQWKMYATGMKQAYAEDPYGGATPEETLALYIEALEKGDFDLAVKYYVPEMQEKVAAELAIGKKVGGTERYITFLKGFLENPKATNSTATNLYLISYPFGENQMATTISFTQNKSSKGWKIVSP